MKKMSDLSLLNTLLRTVFVLFNSNIVRQFKLSKYTTDDELKAVFVYPHEVIFKNFNPVEEDEENESE